MRSQNLILSRENKKVLQEMLNVLFNTLMRYETAIAILQMHGTAINYKEQFMTKENELFAAHYVALGFAAIETIFEILATVAKKSRKRMNRNFQIYNYILIGITAIDNGAGLGYFLQLFAAFIATLIVDIPLSANYISSDEVWLLMTGIVALQAIVLSDTNRLLVKKLANRLCTKCNNLAGKAVGVLHDILSSFANSFSKSHTAVSNFQTLLRINQTTWTQRGYRLGISGFVGIFSTLKDFGAFKSADRMTFLPQRVRDWLCEGAETEITVPKLRKFSLSFDKGVSSLLLTIGVLGLYLNSNREFMLIAPLTLIAVLILCYTVLFAQRLCFTHDYTLVVNAARNSTLPEVDVEPSSDYDSDSNFEEVSGLKEEIENPKEEEDTSVSESPFEP